MQINSTNQHNYNTSFGRIRIMAGAEEVIKNTLSYGELEKFREIIAKHANNKDADLLLFGDGTKKLFARIVNNGTDNAPFIEKSQKFWQSTLSFIEKMSEKTNKVQNKVEMAKAKNKLIAEILKDTDDKI